MGGWELVDDIKSALKTKMAFLGPDSSLHTWMEVRRVVRPRRRLAKKTVARLTSMGAWAQSMATMRFQKGSELGLTWCLSGDLEVRAVSTYSVTGSHLPSK